MIRVLGVDYGDRRIGIAISDPTGTIARPLQLIEGKKDEQAAVEIAALVAEYEVSAVVLGLPRNMDGSEGFRSEKTRKFAEILEEKLTGVPVVLHDERLTTVQADRSLSFAEASKKERKSRVDMMAASLLLQAYLDMLAFRKQRESSEEIEND